MKPLLLGVVATVLLTGADRATAQGDIRGIILQFNGKPVQGVESSTKNKEFKPVFEKELKALAQKLPGKPELKITHWYTIINGGAINWTKADEKLPQQLKQALEKLPYVKSVEFDRPVGIPRLPEK